MKKMSICGYFRKEILINRIQFLLLWCFCVQQSVSQFGFYHILFAYSIESCRLSNVKKIDICAHYMQLSACWRVLFLSIFRLYKDERWQSFGSNDLQRLNLDISMFYDAQEWQVSCGTTVPQCSHVWSPPRQKRRHVPLAPSPPSRPQYSQCPS